MTHQIKEKKCLFCGKSFSITFDGSQSSVASCKKKYCSLSCGKSFRKKTSSKKSIERTCEVCEKIFFKPPSQAKTSRFCSRQCQSKNQSSTRSQKEERKCVNCQLSFWITKKSRRKFCSHYCATLFSRSPTKIVSCEICEKKWEINVNATNRFCSRRCQFEGQSNGAIKIHSGGRSGFRKDLPSSCRFRSSLEADFARFCNFQKIQWKYQFKTFELQVDNLKRLYTPDFFLPRWDLFVEVKGLRKDKLYDSNLPCLEILQKKGIQIVLISMEDFYSFLRREGFWEEISNLEARSYFNTRKLVYD